MTFFMNLRTATSSGSCSPTLTCAHCERMNLLCPARLQGLIRAACNRQHGCRRWHAMALSPNGCWAASRPRTLLRHRLRAAHCPQRCAPPPCSCPCAS